MCGCHTFDVRHVELVWVERHRDVGVNGWFCDLTEYCVCRVMVRQMAGQLLCMR